MKRIIKRPNDRNNPTNTDTKNKTEKPKTVVKKSYNHSRILADNFSNQTRFNLTDNKNKFAVSPIIELCSLFQYYATHEAYEIEVTNDQYSISVSIDKLRSIVTADSSYTWSNLRRSLNALYKTPKHLEVYHPIEDKTYMLTPILLYRLDRQGDRYIGDAKDTTSFSVDKWENVKIMYDRIYFDLLFKQQNAEHKFEFGSYVVMVTNFYGYLGAYETKLLPLLRCYYKNFSEITNSDANRAML